MEKKDLHLSDEQLLRCALNKQVDFTALTPYMNKQFRAISQASADYAVKKVMGTLEDMAFKDKYYRVWGQKLLISDGWLALKELLELPCCISGE